MGTARETAKLVLRIRVVKGLSTLGSQFRIPVSWSCRITVSLGVPVPLAVAHRCCQGLSPRLRLNFPALKKKGFVLNASFSVLQHIAYQLFLVHQAQAFCPRHGRTV